MPDLVLDGARVRYRHHDGPRASPTMLLLHMAGGSSAVFGPLASRLARHFTTIAPDLPGHGRSDPVPLPPPAGLLASYARWTFAFLDALEVKEAILVGHSMGGMVAMLCALERPGAVKGLGLVCTSGQIALPPGLRARIAQDYEGFIAGFVPGALPSTAGSMSAVQVKPVFPQAPREVVQADFAAVDGFNVLPRLPGLRVPSVVVGGRDDRITPPGHAQALAGALSTQAVLLEGGHLLPREHPAKVAEALAKLR